MVVLVDTIIVFISQLIIASLFFGNIVIVEFGIVSKGGPKVSDIEIFMCNCASTNVPYGISYNYAQMTRGRIVI